MLILGGGDPGGALLLSPRAAAGGRVATRVDSYGILRTVEDIFTLDHLRDAADRSTASLAAALTPSASIANLSSHGRS